MFISSHPPLSRLCVVDSVNWRAKILGGGREHIVGGDTVVHAVPSTARYLEYWHSSTGACSRPGYSTSNSARCWWLGKSRVRCPECLDSWHSRGRPWLLDLIWSNPRHCGHLRNETTCGRSLPLTLFLFPSLCIRLTVKQALKNIEFLLGRHIFSLFCEQYSNNLHSIYLV